MICAQSWSIVNFTEEIADVSEIIAVPKFADAKYDPKDFTVGGVNNSFAITKKQYTDDARTAIAKIVDCAVDEDVYQKWVDTGNMTPRIMEFDYSKAPKLFATINDFTSKQKGQSNFWILMPDPVSQEVISTACDELWTQTISAEEFCDKVQKSIDNYLK